MRASKSLPILLMVLITIPVSFTQPSATLVNNDDVCEWDGIRLYGKVQIVEHFPDIKVQVVDHFPDLKVKYVEHFPDECGEWQIVDHFPDFTVQFVENFPDIKIQLVEHFPGLP